MDKKNPKIKEQEAWTSANIIAKNVFHPALIVHIITICKDIIQNPKDIIFTNSVACFITSNSQGTKKETICFAKTNKTIHIKKSAKNHIFIAEKEVLIALSKSLDHKKFHIKLEDQIDNHNAGIITKVKILVHIQ